MIQRLLFDDVKICYPAFKGFHGCLVVTVVYEHIPVLQNDRLVMRAPDKRDIAASFARATDREYAYLAHRVTLTPPHMFPMFCCLLVMQLIYRLFRRKMRQYDQFYE